MAILKNTMNKVSTGIFFWALLTLTACVTINVYFPASQAEKAAERIVDEILGQPATKPEEAKKGALMLFSQPTHLISSVSTLLISNAHAAQPDFSINTSAIKRLRSSMSSRNSKLSAFYNSGAIGFDNKGLVAIKDKNAVSLKERGTLNSLLRAENKDRNALYQEIANANGHPEWEKDVRAVFAKKWSQKARSGWWYQSSNGAWKQK